MTDIATTGPLPEGRDAVRVLTPGSVQDVHAAVASEALRLVRGTLEGAAREARLRVTTLPMPVMERLCELLQGDPRWVARLLIAGAPTAAWQATATKLIELRNTLAEPLLACIPPGLRTAAEDSLDIATFTELSLSDLLPRVAVTLMAQLPEPLRDAVRDAIRFLSEQRIIRGIDPIVEYLVTVLRNGSDAEAAGGALYVFGLVPDFALFRRGGERVWLDRNVKLSATLAEAGLPLQTRLARLKAEPNSIQPPLFAFLRTRRSAAAREWGREIACTPEYRSLSFDAWRFPDAQSATELRIVLDPLSLPWQAADEVGGTVQLPVLDLAAPGKLEVVFRATPPPAQLPLWKHFRFQIISVSGTDGQPVVAWESNSYPRPTSRQSVVRRRVRKSDLDGLAEGTYFLRVEAYDEGGAVLLSPRHVDAADERSRFENESDVFLVTRGEEAPVEPQVARAVFATSLADAWLQAASRGIDAGGRGGDDLPERRQVSGGWHEPIGAAPKGDVHFQLAGAGTEGYTVVVPAILRRLQVEILDHPEVVTGLQLDLRMVRSLSDAVVTRRPASEDLEGLSSIAVGSAFLTARAAAFAAVRGQHLARAEEKSADALKLRYGIVETADLLACEAEIWAYSDAFLALFEELAAHGHEPDHAARAHVLGILRGLAQLDTVEVRWRDGVGETSSALLLAPTHPLRLAWHVHHARVSAEVLGQWREQGAPAREWRRVRDQLRQDVAPTNLPMVLFDARGRAFVEHLPLTSHWPVYLPDHTPGAPPRDTSGMRDTLRHALEVRGRAAAVDPVSADDIAAVLLDYVQQHPYVEQLRINVFNPGSGELVAEALRVMEARRAAMATRTADAPALRYEVQLFGPDAHLDVLGRAFDALLDPDRQVGEDDEFTLSSANHLLPKLVFARNPTAEFVRDPERFRAHVAVFYEHFGVRGRLGAVTNLRRGSYVRGLVHEPDTTLLEGEGRLGWYRGVCPHGAAAADETERTLDVLLGVAQRIQAVAAAGELTAPEVAPVVAVQLDTETQALVRQAHDTSDWVLTIDRNIGLEYFDSPASVQESGYLLDFSPEFLQADGQRLLLTTRNSDELESLVRPALEKLGLDVRPGDELAVLEALRSMSGRLALRLLAAGTRTAEVGGLLLARWMLESAGLLENRLVIPLDAHSDWFSGQGDTDSAPGALRSRRRADLLVVGFDVVRRVVAVAIIEVKWRDVLSAGERASLYRGMREQAENTILHLRSRFEVELNGAPRPDALLRTKELSTLLAFYARRAHRYGLMRGPVLEEALEFVHSLDEGYRLEMQPLGVVFERQGLGAHVDEEEIGFQVHRIGLDVANSLLGRARTVAASSADSALEHDPAAESVPSMSPVPAQPDRHVPPVASALESFRSAVSQATVRDSASTNTRSSHVSAATPRSEVAPLSAVREVPALPPTPTDVVPLAHGAASLSARESAPSAPPPTPAAPTAGIGEEETPAWDAPAAAASSQITSPDRSPPSVPTAEMPPQMVPPQLDALVGANELTPQFGILGRSSSGPVAIDLTGSNTISLFGVQGFGKSYSLGAIAEMATTTVPGVNVLPSPLAAVIFHYHKSDAFAPEMAAAVAPNEKPREIEQLLREYGARPTGLRDVVLLAPESRVDERRTEFPEIQVHPIKFASGELGAEGWKFLLGAAGSDALYVRQLVAIMRKHRSGLTLQQFRREIESAELPANARRLAEDRLALAAPYVDDSARLAGLLRPGRTVIVDLRDEWIEKDEALGLFVVMLRIFARARHEGREFNKLVVFDEAHKYITDSDLIGQVVETIREMRHQATSVVIASQDPMSVPRAIVELTSILLLHRMSSPQWLKHLKSAIAALDQVSDAQLGALQPGEALLWAQRSTDKRFAQRPQRIQVRPRVSHHGGATKTAVDGATVR
jgi:DNA phosphorothioation-dependent restriction protein DptH